MQAILTPCDEVLLAEGMTLCVCTYKKKTYEFGVPHSRIERALVWSKAHDNIAEDESTTLALYFLACSHMHPSRRDKD